MLAGGRNLRSVALREDIALQVSQMHNPGADPVHPGQRVDLVGYEGCPDGRST